MFLLYVLLSVISMEFLGQRSKEKGLYLHAIVYEAGTGFGETGWGKLDAAKKVTWAQLSKHWIVLSTQRVSGKKIVLFSG